MNDNPKKSPALEALDRVRQAEERARAIVLEAREKTAVQIAKEAAEAADEIKTRALVEARKKAEDRKKAILGNAHREAEAVRAETEEALASLRRRAHTGIEGAATKVALRIREFLKRESG